MPMHEHPDGQPNGDIETAIPSDADLTYKYQRLRERLRGAIDSGELRGKLPGERVLAKRYNANAKTINKALTDLAMDGLLIRHVGRGTFVAGGMTGEEAAAAKARTYGCIVPAGHFQRSGETFAGYLGQHLQGRGHRLQSFTVPHLPGGQLPDHALSPGQLRDLSGLVLFGGCLSERFFGNLIRRHLPLVMVHNCHDAVRTPSVLIDYAQGAFELAQHLLQLGHQAIRLVVDGRLLPGARRAETGFRTALMRAGIEPSPILVADLGFNPTALLGEHGTPTAVLCVGTQLATRCLVDLEQAGVGVPGQVSLAVVAEPGSLGAPEQAITAYEAESRRFAEWAMELLLGASPGQIPRIVIVPGSVRLRRSTAGRHPPVSAPVPTAEAIL